MSNSHLSLSFHLSGTVQWQICISGLGGHWFGQLLWLCSVSCHYIDQCSWILLQYIMTTLRSLISPTTQLFVQHLVRVYNKENTNAPHNCPCLRKIHLSLVIAGFPLLSTSNIQIVYWVDIFHMYLRRVTSSPILPHLCHHFIKPITPKHFNSLWSRNNIWNIGFLRLM